MRIWFNVTIGAGHRGKARSLLTLVGNLIRELRESSSERSLRPPGPHRKRPEVLWRPASPMEEYETDWVPHRIVELSTRIVIVEAHPWIDDPGSRRRIHGRSSRTYRLDRGDLERLGVARVRTGKTVFFRSPGVNEETVEAFRSLHRLGLWLPVERDDLRKAYLRKAQEVHPDTGGNEERFLRLQRDRDLVEMLITRLDEMREGTSRLRSE